MNKKIKTNKKIPNSKVANKKSDVYDEMITIEKDNCIIKIPLNPNDDNKKEFPSELIFVAVLSFKNIIFLNSFFRKCKSYWRDDKNPEEIVFVYDKSKYEMIKKIKNQFTEGSLKLNPYILSYLTIQTINLSMKSYVKRFLKE